MLAANPHISAIKALEQNLPNAEQEALLTACLCPPQQLDAYWRQWRASADIEALDDASNRLLPLLFRQAEMAHLADPEMGRLRGIYRYHWCRNQLLLGELRGILEALQQASIKALLLKGAALILQYYRDPGLRPMSDLDIMVHPDQFEAACAVLSRLGYVPRFAADFEKLRMQRLVHAVDFTRPRNGRVLEVDLHWTPLHRATWPGAELPFWEHALHTEFKGIPCRVLDPTYQLMHVCLHGAVWNAMPPFRWVADAMWILRVDDIDWERMLRQARVLNSLQLLRCTLNYLRDHFSAPIPLGFMARLNSEKPSGYERLEYRLQTRSAQALRVDELLLLEWLNHSRAFHGAPWWQRLRSFPNYLKAAWKLTHWHQVPGFVIRRLALRLGARA